MKKKVLLTVIALGVFFISSCDSIQDLLNDNPRNLDFAQKALKADAAIAGVTAGSLSAEGGNGALTYSLVPGIGDEDNELFTVDGAALKIKAASLDEYDYSFRVQVQDGKGQTVEDTFFLKVGPPDETKPPNAPNAPENPDPENPGIPTVPGNPGSDNPGSPDPENPGVPTVPGNSGSDNPGSPDPENPGVPTVPDTPGPDDPEDPVDPGNPVVPDLPSGGTGEGGTPGGGGTSGEGGTPPVPAKPARVIGRDIKSSPGMRFINLSWAAATRAASYEVYYHTADNFASAAKYAEEPTGTSLTVTGLADGTVYYFWVVAKNAGGSAMESNRHTAVKTSDDLPDFLKAGLTPGGPVMRYSATNLGAFPSSDYYVVQDRGENYPAPERYYFGYHSLSYVPGNVKYVRKFANPPEEPAVGHIAGGTIVYDLDWDVNRGVIIYEFTDSNGRKKFQATYYLDEHVEPHAHSAGGYNSPCHAPEAVMGQANGYTSGLGNDQVSDSLDDAIATFARVGNPAERGGRYSYFTMMRIYYAFWDPAVKPYD